MNLPKNKSQKCTTILFEEHDNDLHYYPDSVNSLDNGAAFENKTG